MPAVRVTLQRPIWLSVLDRDQAGQGHGGTDDAAAVIRAAAQQESQEVVARHLQRYRTGADPTQHGEGRA